jgi:ribonuclease-3
VGDEELRPLEEKLGHAFRDLRLLKIAITHPSVSHEVEGRLPHNQRLEFLGDAVLGLVLTRELFEKFPEAGEGPLTQARAHLVNRRALAARARDIGLGGFLILSRSESASGGTDRSSNLADAFEAVVGAVFLDGGYDAARAFLLRCFEGAFTGLETLQTIDNPKGELQELLQATSSHPPRYRIVAATGPDHDRDFECAVLHEERELARGHGKSKQAAESAAALVALEGLKKPPENLPSDPPPQ